MSAPSHDICDIMEQQRPLALVVLDFCTAIVTTLLHGACDALWLMPSVYVALTHAVVAAPSPWRQRQRSALRLLGTSLARWVAASAAAALIVGQACAVQFAISLALQRATAVVVAPPSLVPRTAAALTLSGLVVVLTGFGWSRSGVRSTTTGAGSQQTSSAAAGYALGCVAAQLDALASIGTLVVVVAVVRVPSLLGALRRDGVRDARSAVATELCRSVMDWLLMPLLLVVLVIPLRARCVIAILCEAEVRSDSAAAGGTAAADDGGARYCSTRWAVVGHAFATPLDALCYVAALPVLLTWYRCPPLLRALCAANVTFAQRRCLCISAAGALLGDGTSN